MMQTINYCKLRYIFNYPTTNLNTPQYPCSKFWSGGTTRSKNLGVSVKLDTAASSHGSPTSPCSTSNRVAPSAMNFGRWHISYNLKKTYLVLFYISIVIYLYGEDSLSLVYFDVLTWGRNHTMGWKPGFLFLYNDLGTGWKSTSSNSWPRSRQRRLMCW